MVRDKITIDMVNSLMLTSLQQRERANNVYRGMDGNSRYLSLDRLQLRNRSLHGDCRCYALSAGRSSSILEKGQKCLS